MIRPSVILADEPTGELDSTNAHAIFGLFKDMVIKQGISVVSATHDSTLLSMADEVKEIRDGQLLEQAEIGLRYQELVRRSVSSSVYQFAPHQPTPRRGLSAIRSFVDGDAVGVYVALERGVADGFVGLQIAFLRDGEVVKVKRESAKPMRVKYSERSQVYVGARRRLAGGA